MLLALFFLAGCSAETVNEVTSFGFYCGGDVGDQLKGVSCNGDKHAARCAELHLSNTYGVDVGCELPLREVDGECLWRKRGLDGCVEVEGILCCDH